MAMHVGQTALYTVVVEPQTLAVEAEQTPRFQVAEKRGAGLVKDVRVTGVLVRDGFVAVPVADAFAQIAGHWSSCCTGRAGGSPQWLDEISVPALKRAELFLSRHRRVVRFTRSRLNSNVPM